MKYIKTAARLRAAMEEKGLRSQDLANKTGIGKASISQWLNGRNKPSYASALKLARVLACDPYWLMGEEQPEPEYLAAFRHSLNRNQDPARTKLLQIYDGLDDRGKDKLVAYAEGLSALYE